MLQRFDSDQLEIVTRAATVSEELVSNAYKMSTSQWLRRRYDVKTLAELEPHEIVHGPFAQIVRYEGQRKDSLLGSSAYDFYKICIQDHAICGTIEKHDSLTMFPFVLYILIHELVHIVRFSTFVQQFNAKAEEMMAEETRVHDITHQILGNLQISGLNAVFGFFERWRKPFEDLSDS